MNAIRRVLGLIQAARQLAKSPPGVNCFTLNHQMRTAEQIEGAAGVYGPFLVCDTCGDVRLLASVPDGHPDSMTVELPPSDEAWLAEVDARLFPQEAT